jgi:hypothetical protein
VQHRNGKHSVDMSRGTKADYDDPLLQLLHEHLLFAELNANSLGGRLDRHGAGNISDESMYAMETVQNMYRQNIKTLKAAIDCIRS